MLIHDYSPITLSDQARWLLLKLIAELKVGDAIPSIKNMAKKFHINEKKIKECIAELEDHGILIQAVDGLTSDTKSYIDYDLFLSCMNAKRIKNLSLDKWFHQTARADNFPLIGLFQHLVENRLNDFYMHHLQHTSSTLSGILDFKSALVLMVLVRNSNQFGITNQCGIHKIKHKTGLFKDAIFRCIKTLENQGVIRTRVDGVLSSKILRVSNPFYILNLSHEIWQEKATYGRYFIIQYPQPHHFEVELIASLLQKFESKKATLIEILTINDAYQIYVNLVTQMPDLIATVKGLTIEMINEDSSIPEHEFFEYRFTIHLLSLFLEMPNDHDSSQWLRDLIEFFPQKNSKIHLNGVISLLGFLQCHLEQWCAQIYNDLFRAQALSRGGDSVDLHDLKKMTGRLQLNTLLKFAEDDSLETSEQTIRSNNSLLSSLSAMMTLIAKNQLYPFLTYLGLKEQFSQFCIVPRHVKQKQCACIFMPFPRQKSNQFTKIILDENSAFLSEQKILQDERRTHFFIESIQPSLKELQDFGLLPESCPSMGASSVYAGFGSLSNLASSLSESATGVSSSNMDINGFFTQAKATNAMFIQSRTALASLLANKQDSDELKAKQKSLKTTSNLKEKEAIQKQIVAMSNAVLEASQKDEEATVAKLSALNVEQKKNLLDSATNFVIASLTARELAGGAKQVSTSLITNPSSLTNTGMSLVDAKNIVGDITGIAKNSTMALVEYPKLFKKAGIEFKMPTSSSEKPKILSDI